LKSTCDVVEDAQAIVDEGSIGGEVVIPKQSRRSRAELRDMLLEVGCSVLKDEGLAALTFKTVFERLNESRGVRLTNGSVIGRVWRDQADFRADVLVAVALEENDNEVDRTLRAVGGVLEEMDLSSPGARQRTMRELCRLGGAANLQVMREATNWSVWIGAWGLVASSSEPRDYRERIERAVVAGYDSFNERIEEVYRAMTSYLGFRLREPLTLRQFTIAADSLGQGCGLRDRFDNAHMDGILLPTGQQGELQEWTLFAIGFEGLVTQFFELDPDWKGNE
jgi:hypothetical protein